MVYVCEQDPPVYQSYTRLYCVCTAHKRQTGRDKGSLHVYISSSSTVYHELDIAVHSLYLHYRQSSPAQSVTLPPLQVLVEILNFHFLPLPSKCLMTCIATHPYFEASSLPPAYMPTIKHIRLGVCTSPPCHKKNLHMCNPHAHLPISILLPRHKQTSILPCFPPTSSLPHCTATYLPTPTHYASVE